MTATTIDLMPTWGQWGNLFIRFALEGQRDNVSILRPDFAKAFAAAEAFKAIQPSLTAEQREIAVTVFRAEMAKQGFPMEEESA